MNPRRRPSTSTRVVGPASWRAGPLPPSVEEGAEEATPQTKSARPGAEAVGVQGERSRARLPERESEPSAARAEASPPVGERPVARGPPAETERAQGAWGTSTGDRCDGPTGWRGEA
jgi:hypothetical protein